MYAKLQEIRARKTEREGGFTLIELLVVVVIIGILIAIAIPLYLNYQKGAHNKSAQSDLRAMVSTLEQCYTDNANTYPSAAAQASAGADMTFTGCTLTAKASDATVLTYAFTASAGGAPAYYTITAKNNDGDKTYTYASNVGGAIH
jgi:type IV pilus assembly protein PilA